MSTSLHELSIACEGSIGVGKTTLAKALARHLGAIGLWEDEIPNPYLADFYRQRSRWALPCQLCFLEGRLAQFERPRVAGLPVVADHSLLKDAAFAEANLLGEELALYRRCSARMQRAGVAFAPRVHVHLVAGVAAQLERIRSRGRTWEGAIDAAYLTAITGACDTAIQAAVAAGARVVVVRADGESVARDAGAIERLVDACLRAPTGLSYCNPVG